LKALVLQIQLAGPGALVIWVSGAVWLLSSGAARRYRVLGWTFAALFVLMLLSGSSRQDRIAAAFPIVIAAGAVAIERWADARRPAARAVVTGFVLASAAAVTPLVLPILRPEAVAAYAQASGAVPRIERGKTSPLPQWLADRTGWESFVDDIERVYR